MSSAQNFLFFQFGLFILNIIFFTLKKKEFKVRKLKILLVLLMLISLIILFLRYDEYLKTSKLSPLKDTIISNLILNISLFSLFLFIYSLFIKDQDVIELECPSLLKSHLGKIEIGRVMKRSRKKHKFFLSINDLERHMFVCGATGSGKSNFIQNFLLNFNKKYKIPILLVEFKGEYQYLQDVIEDLLIIKPGENFSINIFDPEGSNPEIHAERIFDILKSGQFLDDESDYSPQMEKVLIEILKFACKNENHQNWDDFFNQCKIYLENQKDKIPFLHQTITSITNRIRRFSLGPLRVIFGTKHDLKIKDLFTRNILFDLSSIIKLGGEKVDALFFLNMVLKYLWDHNLERGSKDYKSIRHITIIEDAQYFVPKSVTKQSKLSTYLEDIALLLRGTGECLISIATRPQISDEILANCGVLVTFKNHMQKQLMCELLNLEEEHKDYLSILEQGECLIRVNSIKRPFQLWIPHIKRKYLTSEEISRNNKKILNTNNKNSNKTEIKRIDYKKDLEDLRKLHLSEDLSDNNRKIAFEKLKNFINELHYKEKNPNHDFSNNPIENKSSNKTHLQFCSLCESFHDKKKKCQKL